MTAGILWGRKQTADESQGTVRGFTEHLKKSEPTVVGQPALTEEATESGNQRVFLLTRE